MAAGQRPYPVRDAASLVPSACPLSDPSPDSFGKADALTSLGFCVVGITGVYKLARPARHPRRMGGSHRSERDHEQSAPVNLPPIGLIPVPEIRATAERYAETAGPPSAPPGPASTVPVVGGFVELASEPAARSAASTEV